MQSIVNQYSGFYKSRKYTIDETFFDDIDSEAKSYTLGLLLSDGWVRKDYQIGFSSTDYELVKIFSDNLHSSYPIRKRTDNGFEILITSHHLFNRYMTYRKSYSKNNSTQIINKIPSSHLNHFIRGYFDGDGCVRHKNNNTQLSFDISGYYTLIEEMRNTLDLHIMKPRVTSIYNHGNIFRIQYCGNRQCSKIYNFLYNNATLYLKRKKDIFELRR